MGKRDLTEALAALADARRADLIERWRRLFKCEPPRYASMELLRRAIGYTIQEKQLGGLSKGARRELTAIANGQAAPKTTGATKMKPGVRLLREWHGGTHEVIATDHGFVWEGTTYRSLSAVAYAITGAKWNGNRFFGLTSRRRGDDV